MNIVRTLLAGSAVLLASCFRVAAWSSGGHLVIAAEAYRQLSPALKEKVAQVLKAHPEYDTWTAAFRGESPGLDSGAFIFMKASTWPDEIRRHHSQYDHPHWHYVDYPLKPPAFPMEPRPEPKDDALYAIAQCERVLADANAGAELRAVFLSYLVHLVGDLHQPLHCASLFDDTYPKGDKGGNDFYVKPGGRGVKLHALWDGMLGTSSKPGPQLSYAIEIQSLYPRSSLKELKKARTPKNWSLESRAVAIEKAYLRGTLPESPRADGATELPPGYTKEAKTTAERRAALAGYRLADELGKYLK